MSSLQNQQNEPSSETSTQENIVKSLQKESGSSQEVLNTLATSSTEQQETNDSEENEDDEEEEECIPMTEEEFQQEIVEAFENIRRLGHNDGQRLARFVRDSFCEINGREPELREMADVFTRIKHKFAEEAKEDDNLLSSSRNIIIKDDLTNIEQEQTTNVENEEKKMDTEKEKKTLRFNKY